MKERLTGAIILVALIVLLVPELLTGPKGRSAAGPANAATGASEELPLRSYTINLGEETRSHSAAAGGNSGPAMPQPGGPDQPPSSSEQSPPASEPQPSTAQSPAGPPPVGEPPAAQSSSSQAPTPQQAPAAAVKPEVPPQHESKPAHESKRESKPAHEPKPTHESKTAAAPASKPVKSAQHSKSANPPAASNSAAAKHNQAAEPASKPESGWAVQLGVFRSRENAERLALDVRVKGFKVSVSPVTSGGSKVYRVRVGPAADRAAAQELQARLKAAGRPAGTVVPYS